MRKLKYLTSHRDNNEKWARDYNQWVKGYNYAIDVQRKNLPDKDEVYGMLQGLLYYFIDEMSGAEGERELRKVAQRIVKRVRA